MRRRRGCGSGAKPKIETRGRVGGSGRANSHRDLRLHVEFARDKYTTVEQLVDHLRMSEPRYARLKLQPFTKQVEKIVEVLSRTNNAVDDSDDDDDCPITKKRRKSLPLVGKFLNNGSSSGQASSVASASSSEGDDTSSSSDALNQENHEGEFDLIKLMLRERLRVKILGDGRAGNDAAESEILDNKDVTKPGEMKGTEQVMEFELVNNSGSGSGRDRDGSEDINGPTFRDFGGIDAVIEELMENVILPFYHPQLPRYLGVKPITGILLHGPPGCGKTTLAEAIANETGVPFYKISAPALVSGVSGSSEQNIRDLFSKANRTAPSIVFIDEIDAIASKRDNLRGMELRIVTQLITCMDESRRLIHNIVGSTSSYCRPGYLLVIGATNRPDALDPALRRPGRFDCEFLLGSPDEYARVQILSKLTCNLRVEGDLDLMKISRATPGFVAADLEALVDKAGNLAMRKIIAKRKVELSKEQKVGARIEDCWRSPVLDEEMENLNITMDDFEEAVKIVQPSSKREGFSNIPNVKWDDVGGLHLLRQEFDRHIIRRIKFPELYENLGLDLETGFLLYGPPGCGKTLIAKAVANEAGANFIYIKGPELLSKYVGESELAVRTIFGRARTCSPCILFFDEIDALTTRRGKEGGWVVERLLNQLLVELDGAEQRKGVYVIGATNRPEVVDPALVRPGRLGKPMYVPLPSPDERGMILRALAQNKLIDTNVDLMAIGRDEACQNFSGADLSSLINEAVLAANAVQLSGSCCIPLPAEEAHFKKVMAKMSPSVSKKQREHYLALSKRFK